ncbi:MAG: glycosyltransferase family 2 protein [Pseudomonadota bacterium]
MERQVLKAACEFQNVCAGNGMSFTPRIVSGNTQRSSDSLPAGLGQILINRGVKEPSALELADALRTDSGADLADVLTGHGLASTEEIAEARAAEFGLGYLDLDREPPDPALVHSADVETCVQYQILPWRRIGSITAYATAQPSQAAEAMGKLAPSTGLAFCVVTSADSLDRALIRQFDADLAKRAIECTPPEVSVRSMDGARQGMLIALLAGGSASLMAPENFLAAIGMLLLFMTFSTTLIRLASLLASRPAEPFTRDDRAFTLSDRRPLPKFSVLIPLYDEPSMIGRIVEGLEQTDYPRELLDVKLLLERRDEATIDAVSKADLPPWITPIILPDGKPHTKPRALNLAMDFCDGEVVGVLDAEDRPDSGQFRAVAEHLRNAPPETACVQCQLAYFNASENWITKCFQIEYAIWFDVLLRGWERMGLPIPLGGTSVYFRRRALRELGGWDAHNVTEDADLGIRLARSGMKCAVLTSTTHEEANCRFVPWIRQRSRWLKGYMLTWLSHMRRPRQLWRDLGPAGFAGFQILFLGGVASYLAMPLFWVALAMSALFGQSVYGEAMPTWALITLTIALVGGQAVMLTAAALALKRRRSLELLVWVPTLLVYWTMGAIAAWKAVFELGVAPYYWDKTRHGITRFRTNTASDGNDG